jgi:hypothetical protein
VCFVIMPFREREDDDLYPDGFFTEVLQSLFTPAITEAGFQVKTAASALGSDMIQRTIVHDLLAADLVLCDLTAHNPNVLFELDMRMHADLPIALVKATGTAAIFDVDYMHRVADYNPNLWTSTIKADQPRLTAHIKGAWENRESGDTFMKLLACRRWPRSRRPSASSVRRFRRHPAYARSSPIARMRPRSTSSKV